MNDLTSIDDPGVVIGRASIPPEDRDADLRIDKAIRERLPGIRAAAQQWQATLGTLMGLLGAGTVIAARDEVRALDTPWGYVFGVLAACALLFAVLATFKASKAASPQNIPSMPAGARERRVLEDRLYKDSVDDLNASKFWTVWALLFLALSFAALWYLPTQQGPQEIKLVEAEASAPSAAVHPAGSGGAAQKWSPC